MLLVSCTGDWTRNTPTVELPAIQSIYRLYNKPNAISSAHFDAEHNYDRRTRQTVYKFLARQLRNESAWDYREDEITDIHVEELLSNTNDAPSQPNQSLNFVFAEWQNMTSVQIANANAGQIRRSLRAALSTDLRPLVGASEFGDYRVLNRLGKGDRIPARWLEGRGTPAILIHPEGTEAAAGTPEFHKLSLANRPILMIDVFQTGVAAANRERGGRWYLSYNQTDDANRIQDIVTAIRWVRSHTSGEPEVIGLAKAALWVVFAAAVSRDQVSVVADLTKFVDSDETFHEHCFVPGLRRAGSLASASRLVRNMRRSL